MLRFELCLSEHSSDTQRDRVEGKNEEAFINERSGSIAKYYTTVGRTVLLEQFLGIIVFFVHTPKLIQEAALILMLIYLLKLLLLDLELNLALYLDCMGTY